MNCCLNNGGSRASSACGFRCEASWVRGGVQALGTRPCPWGPWCWACICPVEGGGLAARRGVQLGPGLLGRACSPGPLGAWRWAACGQSGQSTRQGEDKDNAQALKGAGRSQRVTRSFLGLGSARHLIQGSRGWTQGGVRCLRLPEPPVWACPMSQAGHGRAGPRSGGAGQLPRNAGPGQQPRWALLLRQAQLWTAPGGWAAWASPGTPQPGLWFLG